VRMCSLHETHENERDALRAEVARLREELDRAVDRLVQDPMFDGLGKRGEK
jgi:hypothetical protein